MFCIDINKLMLLNIDKTMQNRIQVSFISVEQTVLSRGKFFYEVTFFLFVVAFCKTFAIFFCMYRLPHSCHDMSFERIIVLCSLDIFFPGNWWKIRSKWF